MVLIEKVWQQFAADLVGNNFRQIPSHAGLLFDLGGCFISQLLRTVEDIWDSPFRFNSNEDFSPGFR